ncbi:MAG: hypothetical protein ABJN36_14795 [Cyclobacteriaceae bacterium]
MSGKFFTFIFGLILLTNLTSAQEIKVRGGFVQDHFEVGDNVDFYLTATYPEGVELVLPDSTFNFAPFEYSAKKYYPSKLKGENVYDTAIYTLQCYEIDPIQYLKLPAIILKSGDSTLFYSQTDSILFNQLAKQVSDTTKLKTNLSYADVDTGFNFILFWIIIGVLVILIAAAILIFGKKVLKAIKLRKLKKDYIQFTDELTMYIRDLKANPQKNTAEAAISKWKQFAERMEKKPYSKLTSKEILNLGYTRELADPLKSIDRFVYGGQTDENLYKQFHSIEDFTQHRYAMVVEEIKNSK